jgi:hypothetical protein
MIAYILAFGTTLSTIILYSSSYIFAGFCLIITYYDYILYEINSEAKVKSLQSKTKKSSIKNENGNSKGVFIDKKYIGMFIDTEKKCKAYVICKKETFEELTSINEDNLNKENNIKIKLYQRTGFFYYLEYLCREINVTDFIANVNQSNIINNISTYLNKHNFCVAFVTGKPGSGKSMCGILLAKLLNGKLVRDFNPTEPGDNLASLYATIEPTKENPLIIVLDEVDIMFENVFKKNIQKHRDIPTQIFDKSTLNRFFDDINLEVLYPHLVIIMTTNVTSDYIETNYDPSYIRDGRVNLKFTLE